MKRGATERRAQHRNKRRQRSETRKKKGKRTEEIERNQRGTDTNPCIVTHTLSPPIIHSNDLTYSHVHLHATHKQTTRFFPPFNPIDHVSVCRSLQDDSLRQTIHVNDLSHLFTYSHTLSLSLTHTHRHVQTHRGTRTGERGPADSTKSKESNRKQKGRETSLPETSKEVDCDCFFFSHACPLMIDSFQIRQHYERSFHSSQLVAYLKSFDLSATPHSLVMSRSDPRALIMWRP
mmetsp:Transcript_47792/g.94308  ORF Transcript_47792/g.94308 Transcript_47792/m.94308 type:complete len:234 (-) Transcript_47792:1275-1976(-)